MLQFVDTVFLHLPPLPPSSSQSLHCAVLCRQNSIFLLLNRRYLCSFESTQLLIAVYLPFVFWMHEQQFHIWRCSSRGRLGQCYTAPAPPTTNHLWLHSMWFSIYVILIFQFSTCLRRTTNKTTNGIPTVECRMNNKLPLARPLALADAVPNRVLFHCSKCKPHITIYCLYIFC